MNLQQTNKMFRKLQLQHRVSKKWQNYSGKDDTRSDHAAVMFVFGGIAALFGWASYKFIKGVTAQFESKDWPYTKGRIMYSAVLKSGRGGKKEDLALLYEFQAPRKPNAINQRYMGDHMNLRVLGSVFGSRQPSHFSGHDEKLNRYVYNGKTYDYIPSMYVYVYYDPQDPTRNTIQINERGFVYVEDVIAAGICLSITTFFTVMSFTRFARYVRTPSRNLQQQRR